MSHFIIGTAGHIDHGKTALVKALTDIDTDRLKEEKERGITIDLGFAYWKDGITIIDVPGHERFIRNMVAGVSAIDYVLLVIAADDGIMPQTIEHLEILKLLHISSGAVVITKIDQADELHLRNLEIEIKNLISDSLLRSAPFFRVSSVQKTGIDELKGHLQNAAQQKIPKFDRGFFRMNIDRSFLVKGFGTILTGTVLSGTARNGQWIELLPARKTVRIRGLQKHSQPVEEVMIGDRAAINVSGIDNEPTKRGNVLAEPGHLISTNSFFGKWYLLKSVKKTIEKQIRVRLHMGTAELFCKVHIVGESIQPGKSGYIRVVSEDPLVCIRGDRFIVREINSSMTLGGGIVLDHLHPEITPELPYLRLMENESLPTVIREFIIYHKIVSVTEIISVFGLSNSIIRNELNKLEKLNQIVTIGEQALDVNYFSILQKQLVNAVEKFHQERPTEKGLKISELRMKLAAAMQGDVFDLVLKTTVRKGALTEEKEIVYLSSYRIQINTNERELIEEIESKLAQTPFSPPSVEVIETETKLPASELQRILRIMVQLELIVKTDKNLYFHRDAVRQARQFIIDFIGEKGHIKITDFKDRFHTSRKFALSLLEYFDAIQVTSRNGDHRELLHP
ncbi:selenocysteine-specific translation elongation factor [bacterium]|nr:MAG: selenocysteine-specific translation elongation factor [bacterium]